MSDVTITPSEDGPYIVSGPVVLTAPRRARDRTSRPDVGVPLPTPVEQAVLRWRARHDRLRRNPGELSALPHGYGDHRHPLSGGDDGWRYPVVMAATEVLGSTTRDERSFLLQRVQPAMTGLIDGSLSTLAPIFSVAIATHRPHYAFFAGLATAIGAGVSMAFSEGLSDTGDLTGRGNPYVRGAITGAGTFLGGILHTLPFLISDYRAALVVAVIVIAFELVSLGVIRWRFFHTGFVRSIASITLGGAIIVAISAALGGAAG